MFTKAKNLQAVEIPLNWNADYMDGSSYSEYDLLTQEKNDFYSIEKKGSSVIRFGLFGQGNSLFFDNNDGSFNINGKRVEIEYHQDNGEVIHLTTNFNKKDLITYKEAYTEYNNKQGEQRSNLSSLNFGYKTTIEKEDLKLFFQPIFSFPINEIPFIEVKITANKNMRGHLIFKSRDQIVDRFEAPLEENFAGQVNWTIK